MGATQYKAIETEYKGTVFKSKSEALFARSLDLINSSHRGWDCLLFEWFYEPDIAIRDSRYKPDFMLDFGYGTPLLVEYKPAKPTKTYVKQFRLKLADYNAVIIYYSFFDYIGAGHRTNFGDPGGYEDRYLSMFVDVLLDVRYKAKEYRFDLVDSEKAE